MNGTGGGPKIDLLMKSGRIAGDGKGNLKNSLSRNKVKSYGTSFQVGQSMKKHKINDAMNKTNVVKPDSSPNSPRRLSAH